MAFSTKYLNDDEHIILDLHPHWWDFVKPSIAIVVSFVAWFKSHDIASGSAGNARKFLETSALWITLGALVLSALWLAKDSLAWRRTHFVLTNQRVIFRSGIVARTGIEIPLIRVNNINFHQSIFERMIGAGDLLIESGGEDGMEVFNNIRDPEQVQSFIQRAMHQSY